MTGCLTLLEIYWNYFKSTGIIFSSWKFWKSTGNLQSLLEIFLFSLWVCAFVIHISYNSCISEHISTEYLVVNQDQLILRKSIWPEKNGGWLRWALVGLDGVAPSWMVGVSASVNLPLHHKAQKFSSGTSWPRWSRKKGRKMVVVVVVIPISVS